MIDERMYSLLRDQLAAANEEKAQLYSQVKSLTEEMSMLRQSIDGQMAGLRNVIAGLEAKISDLQATIASKDRHIRELEIALGNAINELTRARGGRFAPTTEQQKLLNNRKVGTRAEEKDGFDGKKVSDDNSGQSKTEDSNDQVDENPKSKANHRVRKPSAPSPKHVDDTVFHEVSDYYVLPPGAHYLTRNGQIDYTTFEYIEEIPSRTIRHLYKVARVALADGETIVSTLPEEIRKKAVVKGCPFTSSMLAFIMVEKFVYHSPINTVKKKLRNMGAVFSKSTLNRYYQNGIDALMDTLEDTLHDETRDTDYLMIDETCETVGVIDEATGLKKYRKKYLWAFYDKVKNLVSYIYEKGSRAREVVMKFLGRFKGCISTDGYVAYKIFDDAEKHPDITHVGCWTHYRRGFIEALPSVRKECEDMIDMIASLFDIEYYCKSLGFNEDQVKNERTLYSVPIMSMIYQRLLSFASDTLLMSNSLFAKAVNYGLNQWQSLKNFVLNGKVEISNNLCEQMMKTIKLDMKNCQNIGSEKAARRYAFMHSLMESCSLNNIPPLEYLTDLFNCYSTLDDIGKKRAFIPCYYHKET